MAKVIVDVLLKEGTDETTFINDVTSHSEVDLKNRLPNTPTLVVLNVEESYHDTLRSHSSVASVQTEMPTEKPLTYPSMPSKYTLANKAISGISGDTPQAGSKYISFQHYLDTDEMVAPVRTIAGVSTGNNVGNHYWDSNPDGLRDQMYVLSTNVPSETYYARFGEDQTYTNYYTGKNVDIVALESSLTTGGSWGDYTAYHESHPDFDDSENPGQTRLIPMNWPNLTGTANNQVSTAKMLDYHSTGTASAAAGLYGGFAKKSKVRMAYINEGNTVSECLDSIKGWHNAKSVNSETGLKDPTVLILEWHSPWTSNNYAIKIEDIDSVTDPTGGTTNKPDGGWTNDLTAFTSRGMIPFQLRDPSDSSWHWVMPFPWQTSTASYRTSIEQCWDAGIVIISSGGNGGGIYVKESDPRWSGSYCTISGTKDLYTMGLNTSGEQNDPCNCTKGSTSTTNWYRFRVWGPNGLDKAIEVAAGSNSQGCPGLDSYTTRGPGVDIIGRGSSTWTAGDLEWDNTFADGYKWGTYGGTSCAMPTVAGKAACLMEKHYVNNGVWPTPQQVKDSMIAESKPTSMSVETLDWSNVPSPSATDRSPDQDTSTVPCCKIDSDTTACNAGWRFMDHAGTPNRQAWFNVKDFNRENTQGRRPISGVLYPRPRRFNLPQQEEAATFGVN